MKKKLKYLIVIIISFILILAICKLFFFIHEKRTIKDRTSQMPEFEMKTIHEMLFTKENIDRAYPILFLYFNSECDYCLIEIKEIVRNIEKFENIRIFLVSSESVQRILTFQTINNLDNYHNITFLSDYQNSFPDIFNVRLLPSSLVYDKSGKLILRVDGAVRADYLLEKMNCLQ